MMMKSIIPFLTTVLLFLLTGCYGGGVVHSKSETLEHFSLGYKGYILPATSGENPTDAMIIEKWGQPDLKREEKEGIIVWRYKTGVRFAGAVPMVGIGIPLVVPTGSDYVEIFLKRGTAVRAYKTYTGWTGGYYGPENEGTGKNTFNKLKD